MNIKTINGIEIFRPLDRAETDSYSKAKNNLFSKYDKGRITDSNKITRIMNTQFEHFEDILDQWLSILASRGFLEFLLYQYDQYSKVEQKFKDRELSSLDEEFWKEYGSLARRGIKYLIELLCHYQIEDVNPTISSNKLEYLTSIVFIAAEEMCNYYLSSDLTHSILPGKTVLVLDPAQHTYLDLKVIPEHEIVFDIRDDTSNRHRYVGERNILNDFPTHNNILGEAFVE